MKCPKCRSDTRVINTYADTDCMYRKRECLACLHRYVTKETEVDEPMPSRWKRDYYERAKNKF